MNINIPKMHKALFLDRDGIVNEDSGYVYKINDFKFKAGIFDLCKKASANGYKIFIITNQAGIARGFYSERDFIKLTKWMINEFVKNDCKICKVYYSPYHPEYGNSKYKRNSIFRKPAPGMILKAAKRFSLDLSRSVLIGDQKTDVEAGLNAGIKKNLLISSSECKENIFAPHAIYINTLGEAIPHFE